VVSVGNLSVGGSGKTPLALRIAAEAQARGRKVAILTRGFGGDEPELYRQAGWEVFEGADRLASAGRAQAAGAGFLILDDGFQRRHQLSRDADILMLDWSRRGVEAHCLPAGRLREPLAAAREAHAVVVTHAPAGLGPAELVQGLPGSYRGLKVFRGEHRALDLKALSGGQVMDLGWLEGRELAALSGLGKPEAFEALLESLGARVRPVRFPDHHAFVAGDLPQGPFVCSSKDAVKLRRLGQPIPEGWELRITMGVEPESDFLNWVVG
jgi:tetraacyldisaccharide 4'-kinase